MRAWLAEHPSPTGRQLAERGLVAPHWPAPWGLGADPTHQLLVDEELRRAGVRRPENTIGIGWAGPTLLHAGTPEQKERYLLPLLAAEEIWCQLFSEPGAGSDLASLTTRADLDGDEWVVRGQKVWTSYAHQAQFGILLARTEPDAPKHQGISYFICPMDAPGDHRPAAGRHDRGPHVQRGLPRRGPPPGGQPGGRAGPGLVARQGDPGQRAGVAVGGRGAVGDGPTADDLVAAVRAGGGTDDPLLRQRLASVWMEGEILRLLRLRTVSAAVAGAPPGPEASVRKALADEHGKHIMALARDLAGASGMLRVPAGPGQPDAGGWPDAMWAYGFLFAPALTIGGGTSEVQRNIIAERTLGLPHDPQA